MITEKKYKYITIRPVPPPTWEEIPPWARRDSLLNPPQLWYRVSNNNDGGPLGALEYYKPWRQWCFVPSPGTVFSTDCLEDIQNFIQMLSQDSK